MSLKIKITFLLVINFVMISICSTAQKTKKSRQEVDYVNSYIGTAEDKQGATMPFVGPPFAMTNFTAQTNESYQGRMQYIYEDSHIMGFMATHKPTVWMSDYGEVSVMPEVGNLIVQPQDRKLSFRHEDEIVSPYYYSVKMKVAEDKNIKTEIAATDRCGILQFTFPQADLAHIVVQAVNITDTPDPIWNSNASTKAKRLELKAYVKINRELNEITGYNPDRGSMNFSPEMKNFKGYFVIKLEKPIGSAGTWNNEAVFPNTDSLYANKRMGAYISFPTQKNETVKIKIGTSFISIEQAKENLNREIPGWDLEKVSKGTRDIWQKTLERFKIEGGTEEQKTIFYTTYYHCLIYPRQFSEYGRYYSAADDKVHEGVSYNDYSIWDTFRALHPFLIFGAPERVNDMITGMLNMYKEGGWLPMWPNPSETNIMTGTHADAVIADAYVKGFKGYDVNLAYEAMRKDAMMPGDCDLPVYNKFDWDWTCFEGRRGSAFYHSIGYLPSDYVHESASRTLEYALDDYCIAQVAKNLGKTDDYDRMMNWSRNYKYLFNKETGLITPRLFNGDWSNKIRDGYTEGSPQIYTLAVPQDIPGLIDLVGGKEKFAEKLDEFFAKGQYQHDNEPGHHIIYLYDYCGQPWKTQELVRKHINENYTNKPNGINGNDDCGQMSAWYMLGVMGFYPVTPASGIYALGAPQLPKISINYSDAMGNGRTFEIIANKISDENKYVQKVTLDGKLLGVPFISHNQILEGKRIVFEMGPKPKINKRY